MSSSSSWSSSTTTTTTTSTSLEVFLAIYDLSRGMARTLSAQFLGGPQYAVEAIPHTGLVVYNKEYFFGAGIQCEDPHLFRQSTGMMPLQLLSLGKTRVSQRDFERWCRSKVQDKSWDASAYDLLSHNCNNFCHEAALQGLKLARGVPEWILQVPQRFLSSPMGQMVRPMLQQMQLTSPVPGAQSVLFDTESININTVPPMPSTTNTSTSSNSNPWASLNNTATAGTSTTRGSEQLPQSCVHNKEEQAKTPSKNLPTESTKTTPLLDSFTKPLLSSETNMIPLCLQKLKPVCLDDPTCLEQAADIIMNMNQPTGGILSSDLIDRVCQTLLVSCLQKQPQVSFALLFLRILMLYNNHQEQEQEQEPPPPIESSPESSSTTRTCSSTRRSTERIVEWIHQQLLLVEPHEPESSNKKKGALSPVARAAAWLTLGNHLATTSTCCTNAGATTTNTAVSTPHCVENHLIHSQNNNNNNEMDLVVEAALTDWNPLSQPRIPVRQAAGSYLYNVTLLLSKQKHKQDQKDKDEEEEEDTMITSLLCFALEGLEDEPDPTSRLRRLMVLGLLLHPDTTNTTKRRRILAVDLGIIDVLSNLMGPSSLSSQTTTTSISSSKQVDDDSVKCQTVAKELLSILLL